MMRDYGGLIETVRDFWEREPCGTRSIDAPEGTKEFFAHLDRERERTHPFIPSYAQFARWREKKVLEVGIGPGTDFIRFVRSGASATGVDLTEHAVALTKRRLEIEGYAATVARADAEALPFSDDTFDFVYSWGVIHHTPDPAKAAAEIVRVTRPGGEVCVMVYNRRSLVALQSWIVNGVFRGRPSADVRDLIYNHHESLGTQAYSAEEAAALFSGLAESQVSPVVTPYDVRFTRSRYGPQWAQRLVPRRWGWFLVVQGRKHASLHD